MILVVKRVWFKTQPQKYAYDVVYGILIQPSQNEFVYEHEFC